VLKKQNCRKSQIPVKNAAHIQRPRKNPKPEPGPRKKGKLPRLERIRYQGHAVIFWTNTLEQRVRGWLTPEFHLKFREIMVHAAFREGLFCPAYCLMPDHLHLVWMGMNLQTDQRNRMAFLRSSLEPFLGHGREWQHQPYDHILRKEERRRNAFANFCSYTLANPVRDGLVAEGADPWPYLGAIVPGIPNIHPMQEDYWELFWKLYASRRTSEPITPAP
jgi:putative transposase